MQKVKFAKRWRGHAEGSEAELTDERAAELKRLGFLETPKPKRKNAKASTDSKPGRSSDIAE